MSHNGTAQRQCWDMLGENINQGSNLGTWSCSGAWNQYFWFYGLGQESHIRAWRHISSWWEEDHSYRYCLEVEGGSTDTFTRVTLNGCRAQDQKQIWTMPCESPGQIRWTKHPELCLTGGTDSTDWEAYIYTCQGTENQVWEFNGL